MPSSVTLYSRKLLLQTPLYQPGPNSNPATVSDPGTPESGAPASSFDANVVMVLAVLLCAFICALGLNSIVRCALRSSSRFGFRPEPGRAIQLATAGVRRRAIRAIPILVYSTRLRLYGSGTECAICLSDLVPGERVRVLPKCNHGFHVRCIDRWLMTRPSCPTCRQCLLTTAKMSSGCGEVNPNPNPNPSETGRVQSIIVPLEPEGYVHNYRGDS